MAVKIKLLDKYLPRFSNFLKAQGFYVFLPLAVAASADYGNYKVFSKIKKGVFNINILQPGQFIDISVDAISHAGEGIGRWQGMAIFVPFTVPGDLVRARVGRVQKNYARAEVQEVLTPAASRLSPACDIFGLCGGCHLQMMNYEEQLRHKTAMVEQSIARIGKLKGIPVKDTLGMANPLHYRNKVVLQVEQVDGKIKLGFYGRGSHTLASAGTEEEGIAGCLLVDRELNELAVKVEELLNIYQPGETIKILQQVLLRKAPGTGEKMVAFLTCKGKWEADWQLARDLAAGINNLKSVVRYTPADKHPRSLDSMVTLYGKPYVTDIMGGLYFRISPLSFYQVNSQQTQVLYDLVREYCSPEGETVVDAYCGVGTMALYAAPLAGRVVGLEVDPRAVEDARQNAALNNIVNAEFHLGEVEKLLPAMAKELKPRVVLLDPPRRGCHPRVLDTVVELKVPVLVYVSCDPATLARDLAVLARGGYEIKEVQPVDMFPLTSHVESIIMMTYSGSKGK